MGNYIFFLFLFAFPDLCVIGVAPYHTCSRFPPLKNIIHQLFPVACIKGARQAVNSFCMYKRDHLRNLRFWYVLSHPRTKGTTHYSSLFLVVHLVYLPTIFVNLLDYNVIH